jgi:hypothetical protein
VTDGRALMACRAVQPDLVACQLPPGAPLTL